MRPMKRNSLPRGAAIAGIVAATLAISAGSASAHTGPHVAPDPSAPTGATTAVGHDVLILASSVSGGASSREAAYLASKGYTADIVSDADWSALTAAQFAAYDLIVVGDPTCGLPSAVVSQNAVALADAVMGRADGSRAGNRVLIGTDPVFHYFGGSTAAGGKTLIEKSLDFASAQPGVTNLYLATSCYDNDWDANFAPDVEDKLLPLLSVDPDAGTAWSENQSPPCGGAGSVISNADQFATLTSAHLQAWGCSVHMTFPTFPTDWSALAVATDTATKPTCGSDVVSGAPACGQAYVLIAGSGIVRTAPNLALSPLTGTGLVGTSHTITATVKDSDADSTPRAGVEVSFVVTGANAGATGTCLPADCKTDSAGQVGFTYTGLAAGDDTINAAAVVDGGTQSASAAKTWTAPVVPTDTTPPVIVPTVTGTLGDNGWYTSDIGISWSVTDEESDITEQSGCDEASVVADVATVTFTCSATSAGGTASEDVTVKRDATKPTVSLVGAPADGSTVWSTQAAPTCSARDAMSGLASSCSVSGWSAAVGTHTVTATATDKAGNVSTATSTYTVRNMTSTGYYQPVDMGGVYNVVKGGSTVPLKFNVLIDGVQQTDVAVVKSFTTTKIACVSGAGTDDVEIVTTGGTSLRYDVSGAQFVQNWKTPVGAGTCYRATATLQDGDTIVAFFKIK